MRTARLTADLLARKGEARALADTYGTPFLDPLPSAPLAPPRAPRPVAEPTRAGCRLAPEDHRRLRIAAARARRPASELVREAILRFLDAQAADCACLAGERGRRQGAEELEGCCRGSG
ncbi:MAG: hypothetical protein NZ555_12800 [Geminicoccaceae bacterium]|nr:hypothetical protein [Geminicoccaceae bacterium]MCX8102026.1 hypothetical protein [Geminicoccaceae bacterium]MDW8369898.1 hypothetical protein [Geminicoccaceae bacterium]